MKIVSEYKDLDGKIFDTVEACEAAEAEVEKQRKALAEKEKDKSKLRKKLSSEVEKAEEELQLAYQEYNDAKVKAKSVAEEANKMISEILTAAKDKIRDAEKARTEAIMKYNPECGPYQKTYTGDKAREEYNRLLNSMDSLFNSFWDGFLF